MHQRKLNRGERARASEQAGLAQRHIERVCRDCQRPCKKEAAIRSRQQLRCPACGGVLEARADANGNGAH